MLKQLVNYFARFDLLTSFGGWVLWASGLTWAGLMGTAAAYTGSFWSAYGWLGVASVSLFAWIIGTLGLAAAMRLSRPAFRPSEGDLVDAATAARSRS
ncbi:MAG: hypothetical protein ACJ8DK_09925 [Microvirga sp.]|jgi:hypothetical protein